MTENVRAALLLVARGEAPLGIVYETDAKIEPAVKVVGVFPDEGDVDDPNRPGVDELCDSGCDFSFELVSGEADEHVVDGADLFHVALL